MRNPFGAVLLAAIAGAGFSAAPALAQGRLFDVFNQSSRMVTGLNAYPVGADGSYVEDNIGGYYESIGPYGMGTLTLVGDCGDVLLVVDLEGGGEGRATFNTCESGSLILTD